MNDIEDGLPIIRNVKLLSIVLDKYISEKKTKIIIFSFLPNNLWRKQQKRMYPRNYNIILWFRLVIKLYIYTPFRCFHDELYYLYIYTRSSKVVSKSRERVIRSERRKPNFLFGGTVVISRK